MWFVKIKGVDGYHKVKDIKPPKDGLVENEYDVEKIGIVPQSKIEDLRMGKPPSKEEPASIPALVKSYILSVDQNLEKGSAQKRAPFNPNDEKYGDIKEAADNWTGLYGVPEDRDELVSKVQGLDPSDPLFTRSHHKIYADTHSRINHSTGEMEYLLHRGVSPQEHEANFKDGLYQSDKNTSWTTKHRVASKFASGYKDLGSFAPEDRSLVHSAWIPKSSVIVVPKMLADENRHEMEVIVKPGKYESMPTGVSLKKQTGSGDQNG